jgi:hypothetical protein
MELGIFLILVGALLWFGGIIIFIRRSSKQKSSIPVAPTTTSNLKANIPSLNKKVSKTQLTQIRSNLSRYRDRYENAGDTQRVTVIDNYMRGLTEGIVLSEVLNSMRDFSEQIDDNVHPVNIFQGAEGMFGGAGANGSWDSEGETPSSINMQSTYTDSPNNDNS